MGFNRLSDDIIAQIGSFMGYEDNIQFSQTQKRIYNIITRYGYNKPVIKNLGFYQNKPHQPPKVLPEVMPNDKVRSCIGKSINEYSSIEDLTIFYDSSYMGPFDLILMDLLTTRTKISKLDIMHPFDEEPHIYFGNNGLLMNVCKKFSTKLWLTNASQGFYRDEIFIQACPIATLDRSQWTSYKQTWVILNAPGLTDKTLEVLKHPQIANKFGYTHEFHVQNVVTSFTIKGIKSLVNEISQPECYRAYMNLGVLKYEEEPAAVEWMREYHSKYHITRNEKSRYFRRNSYMIRLEICNKARRIEIEKKRSMLIMFKTQSKDD